MLGFINIVKYSQSEFDITNGFDLEQLILLKREHNLQFENLGEPVTKFVYYDASLKEYNAIFLYDTEQEMIDQHVDYLTNSGHMSFPDLYRVSKYGPLNEMDVMIRPITIDDDLIRKMRGCLELGYIRFLDEDDFDALDVSDATKFNDWTISSNVDNTWTSYPDDSITTDKDFEYFMYETRGMALNVESNNIASRIPYGVEYFENDLKTAINTSKTANFSTNFFTAITDLGVAVDNSQF